MSKTRSASLAVSISLDMALSSSSPFPYKGRWPRFDDGLAFRRSGKIGECLNKIRRIQHGFHEIRAPGPPGDAAWTHENDLRVPGNITNCRYVSDVRQ